MLTLFFLNFLRMKGCEAVAEYKLENCTVRIHGTYDPEVVKTATEKYLKKVVRSKKNEKKKTHQVGQRH